MGNVLVESEIHMLPTPGRGRRGSIGTWFRVFIALSLAALLGGGLTAAPRAVAVPGRPTPAEVAAGQRMMVSVARAIEALPPDLAARPLRDPAVNRFIHDFTAHDSGLDAPPPGGCPQCLSLPHNRAAPWQASPRGINPIAASQCLSSIAAAAAQLYIPGKNIISAVKKAGGVLRFAQLFADYASGKVAAGEVGPDAAKLFDQFVGVPGLLSTCSHAFG